MGKIKILMIKVNNKYNNKLSILIKIMYLKKRFMMLINIVIKKVIIIIKIFNKIEFLNNTILLLKLILSI